MTSAYVLINCDLGADEDVIEKLKEIDEVVDAFGTFGTFDIMARVDGGNLEQVREIIAWKIQKIDKIRSTTTLMRKE